MVRPSNQIVRVWRHFHTYEAHGALIVHLWKGTVFWPCLCPDGTHLSKYITDWVGIPEFNAPANVAGRYSNTLFNGKIFSFTLKAVYIDFSRLTPRKTNRGFCLSLEGLCSICA